MFKCQIMTYITTCDDCHVPFYKCSGWGGGGGKITIARSHDNTQLHLPGPFRQTSGVSTE
jgi:hypothetical protein